MNESRQAKKLADVFCDERLITEVLASQTNALFTDAAYWRVASWMQFVKLKHTGFLVPAGDIWEIL